MRLKTEEITIVKNTILSKDSLCRIILFGSRADDNKKGGDIDLLLYSQKLKFDDKLEILTELNEKLGEQKIDILIAQNNNDPFIKIAEKSGVEI